MPLDMERIMILMQRRYNKMYDISKLTRELMDAVTRDDQVSAAMLLQMRGEEMEQFDVVSEEIWEMSGAGIEEERTVRRLMTSDPAGYAAVHDPTERKIFEIRQKTVDLVARIREIDRRMNQRTGGDKSYYATAGK